MEEIVNRVASSALITIDMEEWVKDLNIKILDIAPALEQGFLLREMPFRKWVKELDMSVFENTEVAIFCSTEAIVPTWAYMLIAVKMQEHNIPFYVGTKEELIKSKVNNFIEDLELAGYQDKPIVIKGCGKLNLSPQQYAALTAKLQPVARSIMFGEPCSTVPVYKKKRVKA
jgi:hypothetical protein